VLALAAQDDAPGHAQVQRQLLAAGGDQGQVLAAAPDGLDGGADEPGEGSGGRRAVERRPPQLHGGDLEPLEALLEHPPDRLHFRQFRHA
jgi:hypothetical protein